MTTIDATRAVPDDDAHLAVYRGPRRRLGRPTTALTVLIDHYVRGRLARGEIGARSAQLFRDRLNALARSFGDRPLDQLDRQAIVAWQEATFPTLSPAARRAYLSTVRVFARWLVAEEHLAADPTVKIGRIRQPRSVPRALTAAATARIIGAARNDRERLIVSLMLDLGLRAGEVASARLDDYDPEGGVLVVVGKNSDARAVPVPDHVAVAIHTYHAGQVWKTGPLIHAKRSPAPVNANTIGQVVAALFWRSGVKQAPYDGRSGHALRHSCASDTLDACNDLRVVQQLLGHANLTSTQIYLRGADLGQIRAAMAGRRYGR